MNQKGQAIIEALISGALGLLGLYYISFYGLRIIQSSLEADQTEERYLYQLSHK